MDVYTTVFSPWSSTAPNPHLDASTCSLTSFVWSKYVSTGPVSCLSRSFTCWRAMSWFESHTNSLFSFNSCLREAVCHRESGDKPGEVGDHAQYGLQLCLVVWGSHFSDPLDRVRVRLDAFSCQSVPKIAHLSHAYDALFLVELHPSLSLLLSNMAHRFASCSSLVRPYTRMVWLRRPEALRKPHPLFFETHPVQKWFRKGVAWNCIYRRWCWRWLAWMIHDLVWLPSSRTWHLAHWSVVHQLVSVWCHLEWQADSVVSVWLCLGGARVKTHPKPSSFRLFHCH